MGIFSKLFGNAGADETPPSMPWDQHPSIYEHVRQHVVDGKPGLTEGGEKLPDEDRISAGSKIRWAPGAMDGVAVFHMGKGDNEEPIKKATDLVVAYCNSPTAKTKAAIYQHIIEGNSLPLIDPITESLVNHPGLNHQRLYELAHSFVTEAPDREPVKFGIAILGLFQVPENEVVFQTLGRHEEFTLFCAVALSRILNEPEQSLWILAKNVDGWGRIHVVERLAETENAEIKHWLLREGYKNSIMYEYLAYTCATAGGLVAALSQDSVDRELLTSAGELLNALVVGGPAQSMDHYDDGALATEMFVTHQESAAELLVDFIHVNSIKQFLSDDKANWDERAAKGWTTQRRNEIRASCDRILVRPQWEPQARTGLKSSDDIEFHNANQIAQALGIATWESHWNRLQQKPMDSGRWFYVMAQCNDDRIGDVVAFAEQTIDLTKIATGPGSEMGFGPGFEHHQCLDYVLQELCKFPGHGQKLIDAGLRSPVIRGRNMALAAMASWDRGSWPKDLVSALEAAIKIEPESDVRERMEKVLRGEPLTDYPPG